MQQCSVAGAVGIAAAKGQMYFINEHWLLGIMEKKKMLPLYRSDSNKLIATSNSKLQLPNCISCQIVCYLLLIFFLVLIC